MNIITLDYETFFDADFTLSKMTTESYVRDPRFEVHGVAIRWDNQTTLWHDNDGLKELLSELDWSTTACLCHHAQFDGLILAHHYGIKPAMWLDTLSMARLMVGNHISASLDSLSKHFGLSAKNIPYNEFKGKHWHEMSPDLQRRVADGACQDVELTWQLFQKLAQGFPEEEYHLIDATVRMFTEPVLIGNVERLGAIWTQEKQEKEQLLAELQVTPKDLGSDSVFAKLLRDEGVEPDTKPAKNGDKYAFAKTDEFMVWLLDNESPRVQALAEARLQTKSNIVQTRSERLGWMATRGPLCVYLAYAAAHTTRFGGGDKLNWQNFPRASALGEAIGAPPGHLLAIRDASQIECRLLNMVAGQTDKIDDFREGRDPYVGVASAYYGFEVNRKDHPEERQVGKVLELQCGYGSGAGAIWNTLRKAGIDISQDDALRARDAYRGTHPAVTALWRTAGDVLHQLHAGNSFEWTVLRVQGKRIYLPNGAPLIYDTIEWHQPEDGEAYWRVATRRGFSKLYGAKFVENIIQALARVHVTQAWLRCRQAGIRMVSMEHDKLIAVVAEHEAQAAYDFIGQELARAPTWLPDIPLDSDGYISRTFAKGGHGAARGCR